MPEILSLDIRYRGRMVDLSCSAPIDEVLVDIYFGGADVGKRYRLVVSIRGAGGYEEELVERTIDVGWSGEWHMSFRGKWRLPPYPGRYVIEADLVDVSSGRVVARKGVSIDLTHAIPWPIKWLRYEAPVEVEGVRSCVAEAVEGYVKGRISAAEAKERVGRCLSKLREIVDRVAEIVRDYGSRDDVRYLNDIERTASEWMEYATDLGYVSVGDWSSFVEWLNRMDARFVNPIISAMRELSHRLEREWRERVRRREELIARPPRPVIVSVSVPRRVEVGSAIPVRVVVANEGGGRFVGYLDARFRRVPSIRSSIIVELGPAERKEVELTLSAPRSPGSYDVVIRLCDANWREITERVARIEVMPKRVAREVHRIKILWVRSVNPGRPGGRAVVRACLANDYGEEWVGTVVLKQASAGGKVVASERVSVPPRTTRIVQLDFEAPSSPGTYTYVLEAIRLGATAPDDTREIAIYVPSRPATPFIPAPIGAPTRARRPSTTARAPTAPSPHAEKEVTKPVAAATGEARSVAKAIAVAIGLGGALALLIKALGGR